MNDKQERLAKLQCILTGVTAACCLGVFFLVCTLMPRAYGLAGQAQTVLTDLESVTGQLNEQMDTILINLDEVTKELAQADLAGMVENVETLVTTAQESLEQTMGQLNSIDFQTLNKAIEDLSKVVEPMSKLMKVFGEIHQPCANAQNKQHQIAHFQANL